MLQINTKVHPVGFPPVSKTLPQAVKKIAETLKPEKIILFGSYAYGKPTPDSDVDLLVIMRTKASHKERYLAVARLLRPRQFPIDIVVKTPDEIDQALKNQGNFFIREILAKGKVLYERE
jgi:predicted nucleotidyltransferase